MSKQRLLLLLNLFLVLALLMAACAPAAAPAPTTGSGQTASTAPADGVVTIKYQFPRSPQEDFPVVQDALNEMITSRIGVRLVLEPIDPGVYNDKMQLALASGEECDIIFTAPWTNSYLTNVANGVLYPLDDLLPVHAPGLWASMPPSTWEAARAGGHIYAVINQQIFPKPWGVNVRKDLLEKYNFSLDNVEKWEDMEPFLAAVRDGEGINPVYATELGASLFRQAYYGFAELGPVGITVRAADESRTILSMFETPEFKEAADLTKKWVDEGYFPLEGPPADAADAMFRAGQFAMNYHVEKPGNDIENQNRYGWEFVSKNLTDPLIIDTGAVTATMNGICATSKNPEKALEVLELFNTDIEIYNTLSRGIQGRHWVWVDEEKKVMGYPEGITGSTSPYNPNADWMFGNQFNAYYRDARQVGAWEKTKEMNDTAFPATVLGFSIDTSPINTELAQVKAVWDEYVVPIQNGFIAYDDAAPAAIERLNAAGMQTVLAEVQRQVDEWAANR
ncbi:MAG: ABC transporter substrate-binding protein [Caldilineaceae bacterium]|nr:ABC transporter substrate-binding protein [Caldilineaceae bacterium]